MLYQKLTDTTITFPQVKVTLGNILLFEFSLGKSYGIKYISNFSDKCQENLNTNVYRENCLSKSCHESARTSYFWCFLSLRFPSFICGSLYQCVLFLYILFLVLPIFEVPVPNSVVPNFSRSYVWCFLLLRSYLCVFLSLCYPKNGEAPVILAILK